MKFLGKSWSPSMALLAGLALAPPGGAAEPAKPTPEPRLFEQIVRTVKAAREAEFTQTLTAVLRGARLGPGDGWFKKQGQSRYGWDWLADRYDANHDGRITREEFKRAGGPPEFFDRLDRDRDGTITKSDLDWSDASPYWMQNRLATQLLRRADKDGDRKLSKAEWEALFKQMAKNKDTVDVEDLRALLFPPPPPRKPGEVEMPTTDVLLKGLFKGELGSPLEGPKLGDVAPDFTLTTHDGKKKVTLSRVNEHKPVVLIFGSFT